MAHRPDLLLRGATIVDPTEGTNRSADILIQNGEIAKIGPDLPAADVPEFDCEGAYVSPGWMDMHVHFREPGFEHKETIKTGCRAAAAGGFTEVACMPNTDPPLHTRDVIEFVIDRARDEAVAVHPIGCVSKERKGKELAEMADMEEGGAVAFSDDGAPVYDSELMRRALEYSQMLDRPIINHMEDLALSGDGHMHEGAVSTRLGIEGSPSLAEDVMVARDLILAEFTGGHVHVAHISTAGAVELVRRAKARDVNVTAEVCTHHLALTDEAVEATDFDTSTKMHPPLRSAKDVLALKEGLSDGTIDVLCTDHAPHATFEKEVEFTAAPFGIIGLETAWGLIGRELLEPGGLSLDAVLHALVVAPRKILRLPVPQIEVGELANLTIFNTGERWTFAKDDIRSKSQNTPFVGEDMIGRPLAIYNRGRLVAGRGAGDVEKR